MHDNSDLKALFSKLTQIASSTGIAISGLIGTSAIQAMELGAEPAPSQPQNPILISQSKSSKQPKLNKEAIEIQKVIQQGIRDGNIESALKKSSLNSATKSTLRRLTPQDLKTLGSIKEKVGGLDPRAGWVGVYIF